MVQFDDVCGDLINFNEVEIIFCFINPFKKKDVAYNNGKN